MQEAEGHLLRRLSLSDSCLARKSLTATEKETKRLGEREKKLYYLIHPKFEKFKIIQSRRILNLIATLLKEFKINLKYVLGLAHWF